MKLKQNKRMLIIDIGSASVGAGVLYTKDGMPIIENVQREPITTGSEQARQVLEKNMFVGLKKLITHYAGEYSAVRIIVAAPWYSARIRTLVRETEKPKLISEKTVSTLVADYKNEVVPIAIDAIEIESVAVQIQVNNYDTLLTHPVFGTHVRINLYHSEIPENLHHTLTNTILEGMHHTPISLHTFPLIASAALRSLLLQTSFIFVDVRGEVTEVGVMYADGIHFLASIPIGYWTLLRNIDEKKVGDLYSRLTLYTKNELSQEEMARTETFFTNSFRHWLNSFEEILKEMVIPIPQKVYLISERDPGGWFKKGIEQYGTMDLVPILITSANVEHAVNLGKDGTFDVFLALASIFFHTSEREVLGEPKPR